MTKLVWQSIIARTFTRVFSILWLKGYRVALSLSNDAKVRDKIDPRPAFHSCENVHTWFITGRPIVDHQWGSQTWGLGMRPPRCPLRLNWSKGKSCPLPADWTKENRLPTTITKASIMNKTHQITASLFNIILSSVSLTIENTIKSYQHFLLRPLFNQPKIKLGKQYILLHQALSGESLYNKLLKNTTSAKNRLSWGRSSVELIRAAARSS